MAQFPVKLSIIVPALDEEECIERVIGEILGHVDGYFEDYEVILVDDGSSDRTGELMDGLAGQHDRVQALHNDQNQGLGASYRRGVERSRFEYVMLLCGDGGLPAQNLKPVFENVGNADIVIPYMVNLKDIKSRSRLIVSRAYTGLLNLVFGLHLQYYNGLPVHRRDLLGSIEIESTGFAFQGEVLVKLIKSGASYVEVGVVGSPGKATSSAFRLRNVVNVARTLAGLFFTVRRHVRSRASTASS